MSAKHQPEYKSLNEKYVILFLVVFLMAAPAPLNSFFGGLSMSIPIYVLTLLNGSVFGIAGFVHRASRGSTEAMAAVAGLICGGIIIGSIESEWSGPGGSSVSNLVASGFLAGLGTKVRAPAVTIVDSPPDPSIAVQWLYFWVSRRCRTRRIIFSPRIQAHGLWDCAIFNEVSVPGPICLRLTISVRSILATAIFFITGAVMAHTLYGNLDPIASLDWSLGINERKLIVAQIVPFAMSGLLYLFVSECVH